MSTTAITIRVDTKLKKEAEELFDSIGINTTTAITMFLKAAVRQNEIPFRLVGAPKYNKDTVSALKEAEEISKHPQAQKHYKTAEALTQDILAADSSEDYNV